MSISVLLVEDNEKNMRAKKVYLETFECGPIVGVRDPDSAIHAIRTLPHFDLVVADIDLSEASAAPGDHNKGGVAVAKWLRETNYPAFIAGYSSYFADDDISEAERSIFDDMVDRSVGGDDLNYKFERWISEAKESDRTSSLKSLLFEAYAQTDQRKVSTPVPVVSLDTLIDYCEDDLADFRSAGYQLRILLPDVDDEIKKAIPVWILFEDGRYYIEVVGQPYLFSEGSTENEARAALSDLMLGYYNDLKGKDPNDEMGSYIKMMFKFLNTLFD